MTRLSRAISVCLFVAPIGACAPEGVAPTQSRTGALGADPGNLDILFMIDNSSSMTTTQTKLLMQDPGFMTVLENLPNGLPNIHVAVVSSDMGAPSDQQIGCTLMGDEGVFQSTPRGTCTSTTLTSGATYISNVDGQANYTGNLQDVFGCIALLGQDGCGFEHQLAAVARALGADGSPPPSANVGFLRDDAELAIVLLTNEDDCSATPPTTIYSDNGYEQNIANPDGPIANYRCNGGPRGAHYCQDPANGNAWTIPPLLPPADAQGTAADPRLNLVNCEDNEQPPAGTGTSALTSVSQFVDEIKFLKADPNNQIVVGAISPPVTPYTVNWAPPVEGVDTQPGELWPEVMHSCGAASDSEVNPLATELTTDGSFGDPGVRLAQWVNAFGANGVLTSICAPDYQTAFQSIANRIQAQLYSSGAGGAAGQTGGGGQTGAAGGASGTAGSAGAVGSTGTAGTNGGGGTGTTGAGASGGASGAGGSSGGGTGGPGAAGSSGAGTAGMNGGAVGTGGGPAGGAAGKGTGGAGTAGIPGTGAAGAGGAGATAGAAGAGAGGVGAGAGHGGEGGAGASSTTGGPSGCSCDTGGGARPSELTFGLLLVGILLLGRGRAAVKAISSRPPRR